MGKKLWIGFAVGTLLLGAVPAWTATRNVPGTYPTIQAAITAATAGDTILVAAGTYTEVGQIVINKNLSIVGADKATTIIKPNANTGSSSDAKGWWVVSPGVVFNLSGVTLDGNGYKIFHGIRDKGTGTIHNVHFTNITYNASGPEYAGFAIYAFGQCGAVDVSDSVFDNIGREGIAYWGAGTTGTYTRNTYTGKGLGDWLDYGVEVTNSAVVTITDSTITNNRGIATLDGSNSAGIIVLLNSTATISGSTFTGNYYGINVGYAAGTETPVAQAHNNNISGNYGLGARHASEYGTFDATNNWWGDSSGPSGGALDPITSTPASGTGDAVSDYVNFDPWLGVAVVGAETKEIPASTTETVQNGELGIGADVTTNGNGSSTVTLVKYSANPSGIAFDGSFYDLSISDTGNVSQIILKLYYNDPVTTNVYWFNGSAWALCSDQAVVAGPVTIEGVTYDNRVEVTINNTTTPSLNELKGTIFALATPKSPTGDSGSLPVGPLAAGVSAFLVWWKRRKQR